MEKQWWPIIPFVMAVPVAHAQFFFDAWKGEAELGGIVTSGNTKTQSLSSKLSLVNEQEKWRNSFRSETLVSSDAVRTTAERYLLAGKSDYKFGDESYIFGLLSADRDRFSGYKYRLSLSSGYGRRLIQEENLGLDLEAGPGVRRSRLQDGPTDNELFLGTASNFFWNFSETSALTQTISTEFGTDITIARSITGLKTQIAGNLAMKVTITSKYTSIVPESRKKTDIETAITMVYGFRTGRASEEPLDFPVVQ